MATDQDRPLPWWRVVLVVLTAQADLLWWAGPALALGGVWWVVELAVAFELLG